jgi:hypothetical protein
MPRARVRISNASYRTDLDERARLAEHNRTILIERGFTPDEADAIIKRGPPPREPRR